jgi:hypothetical protein
VGSELREAQAQAEQLRLELAQARQEAQEAAAREQGLGSEVEAARVREAAAEVCWVGWDDFEKRDWG